MKNIIVTPDLFTKEKPKQSGLFLWKNSLGVELIKVVYYPSKIEFGMKWDSYYGIPSMRGKNVAKLQGEFLEVIV